MSAIAENPENAMLHTNFTALSSVELELLPIDEITLQSRGVLK